MTSHRVHLSPWPGPGSAPAAVRAGTVRALGRETLVVAAAMLVYFVVRNLTAGSASAALANARRLADLERSVGIAWEQSMQSAVLGSDALVTAANWVYVWGHWPVIIPSAIALFVLSRPGYRVLRDAIILSGVIGFAFFAFFPVAPPRLADPDLVDTVVRYSEAYRALQPPGLTNQYAAFPSLHVGWNLLVGIALLRAFTHPVIRGFAVVTPIAMALAVVVTANHFVLDVVAGVVLVLIALRITERVARPATATLVGDDWRLRRSCR